MKSKDEQGDEFKMGNGRSMLFWADDIRFLEICRQSGSSVSFWSQCGDPVNT